MKVGVLLPTFRHGASDAFHAAAHAARAGVDGVFAYDHLWPMGHPERPSLAPFLVLAAVASREVSLDVGPLVARVGLVGSDVLVQQFRTLATIAPGRVIAALGTGDKLSEAENDAYGLARTSATQRRERLEEVARALSNEMEVWIGGGAPATNHLARELAVTLNLWDQPAEVIAGESPRGATNWSGNPRDDLERQLDELALAGSTWAVFAPTVDLARLGAWRRASRAAL